MEGAHWSAPNSFGGRAFFRAERNISYLLITNVTAEVSKLLIVTPKHVTISPITIISYRKNNFLSTKNSVKPYLYYLFDVLFLGRGDVSLQSRLQEFAYPKCKVKSHRCR